MIRVLHLRQGEALYGADRAVLALAAATPAPYAGIVGAIARPGAAPALAAEAERRGLPAKVFESASRFDLRCARAVARAAREDGVRLLHAHDFKSLFVAVVAGALARVPVVATFHGDTRSSLVVRLYEMAGRALANFTRGAVAVSRPLLRTLRRWVRAAPVEFVPNALPPAAPITGEERALARERFGVARFCVAIVGRLSPEKGHRVLFEAMRGLDATLLVAGDGPLRDELRAAAAGLDARFLGYLGEARAVFAAADAVAIPSLREGLPLVALEALALGSCVVASAVGELPEVFADGAGVLVPPGDAAALSEALRRVQTGGVCARETVGRRALARAQRYDVTAMGGAYASLYGRALAPSSNSR